jgi:hypothetical protein
MPFDLIINASFKYSDAVRIARIGRMYKLIKLTRLIRILKVVKNGSSMKKQLESLLKIGAGFERLTFFFLMFVVLCHIVACLWIFLATLTSDNLEGTWMADKCAGLSDFE